jgi:hypothetical protein
LIFDLLLQYTNSQTMKTAEQLRELAANHKTISLAEIEHRCTRAAESGATSIMIFDRLIDNADFIVLQEKGIKASYSNDAEGFHWELDWNL